MRRFVPIFFIAAFPAVAEESGSAESQRLIDLAALQLSTKEFGEAERTLESAVSDIEHRTDRYDPMLVRPLAMLGDALLGQGEAQEALDAYGRAVHVARVNDGLHAPSQVDIVYKEAAALIALGEPGKANSRQEYAYEVLLRSHGPASPELVPGLYKLADWYRRTNNVFSARGLYEHAVRVLERAYGETDARVIPALRGVAETYRLERFPPHEAGNLGESQAVTTGTAYPVSLQGTHSVNRFSEGEIALQRIIEIQKKSADSTPEGVALAVLDLADWYVLFDKWSRALPLYEHAQELMREDAELPEDRIAAYFGQPVPLYLPLPESASPPPPALRGSPAQGYVELAYSVDDRGMVGDLTTLDSQPQGLLDFKVRRAMRAARFRPRFEGTTPVATENLKYRHQYSYYPRADEVPAGAGDDGSSDARRSASSS